MKRLAVILTGFLLLAGLSMPAWAQAPLATYGVTAATGDAYHQMGQGAVTLWSPGANDTLNRQLLVSESERVRVSAYEAGKYPAGISLSQEFSFGNGKFSSLAMTADGFVFFGSRLATGDAADSVIALINVASTMSMFSDCKDFIYSGFLTSAGGDFPVWETAILKGGDNTRIGYEKSGDVVYICYENVNLCDKEGNAKAISWNYKLDLASGNVELQIKDFSSLEAGKFQYVFSLFGSSTFDVMTGVKTDGLWLNAWTGEALKASAEKKLSVNAEAVDGTYAFAPPAPCEKIESFTMTWDEQFSSVTDVEVNIGAVLSADKGEKVLFILSKEATLSGDNLPKDGIVYADGAEIGSGVARVGTRDQYGIGVNGVFRNLEPGTVYYCHAFAYNDACSGGVKYGTPQTKPFTTRMGAPETDKISMGSVAETSFKMTLPAPASGLSYVVAVSEESLLDGEGNFLARLDNGTEYTAGQDVDYGLFTVKGVNVGAGEFTVEGLQAATPYYVAVWHMKGSGTAVEYSYGYAYMGQRTVSEVPVTFGFESEEISGPVRGWTISREDGKNGFEVRSYHATDEAVDDEPGFPDDPGIGLGLAAKAAPGANAKMLVSQLDYIPDDDHAPETRNMSAYAISPVLDTASFATVAGIFNVAFLTRVSWDSPESAYKPQDGDSAVISWASTKEAGQWHRLVKLDQHTAWDNDGFAAVTTPAFTPNGNFRFKVDYYRTAEANSENVVMFAVQGLEVEEDLPCKYPTDITVVESELGATTAKLTWEDNNRPFAQSFKLMYQAQGETDWDTVETRDAAYVFEKLNAATTYNIRIQAVCAEAAGVSLVKTAGFTTFNVLPYLLDVEKMSGEIGEDPAFPDELKNYRGGLDGNLQPLGDEDMAQGWVMSGDGMGYPMLNLSLVTEANTWLMLPVVFSEKDAVAQAKVNIFNWGRDPEDYNSFVKPDNRDTLWMFMSETGEFARADRREIGFIVLKDLEFACDTVEEDGFKSYRQKFNEKTFEFEVRAGKKYFFAFYVPGIDSDPDAENVNGNNLSINRIDIDYGTIIYPAVTDIFTENLGKTSISLSWTSSADSVVVIYKPRSEQKFDTVGTKASHIDLTGLLSGTRYECYIYGIYGDVAGQKSSAVYFQTLAECKEPTGFAVIQTFWDGARITGHSDNTRFIHIKSEGEVVEYYVNTVMEWTSRRDTLRLRGLHVAGVDYPYSVKLRSVCGPGDSSVWTEPIIFRTTDYPEIGTPTNLKSTYNATLRSAEISWTPGQNNDFMLIYYGKAGEKYDTVATEATSYILRNLEKNVVYKWLLQPLHDDYLLGDETATQEFNTSGVANQGADYAESLRIRAYERRIVVDNPDNLYIKTINIYDVAGRRLKSYPVNDGGNVFVETDLPQGVVLVEVLGESGERAVAKTVIM
ncbi:MAG: fibronectin type III domain-containing protein [Bacteroides sp.]|nr:fibronectin type III domain-containing protein [Bacteroides sp.]MCM1086405.1 fibronectin type III domain-containing protein [Bacteroides sp.]